MKVQCVPTPVPFLCSFWFVKVFLAFRSEVVQVGDLEANLACPFKVKNVRSGLGGGTIFDFGTWTTR